MSTTTYPFNPTHNIVPVSPVPPVRTATVRRALKTEWTKLRTLPSTWRTAVMAVTVSIALGIVLCISQANGWASMTPQQRHTFDPTSCSLAGIFLIGVVLLGALGARTVTSEYATGMIRSTFTAMPTRRRVLAAKAAVTAAFVFPAALLCAVLSFVLGQRVLAGKHLQVSLGHPGVLEAIVFAAVAVSLVVVIGVGLGALIRHTAATTTVLAVVIVGGLTLGQFVPAGLRQYLPGTALQATVTVNRSVGLLRPGTAIIVLGLYAAVILVAASIRMAHRDA
ncbi:MAG TPA: ABC transporter permease [Acidimicrobiales bacterium]|nr:ABC transporter permease [Acidimicrobiales bacterium]